MVNEYCHLCKAGGKQCIEVNEAQDYAMKTIQLKCSVCGKLLIE